MNTLSLRLLLPVFISLAATSCKENKIDGLQSARAAIDSILKIQEEAYDANSEASRKIMQETCDDSLLFIGGDDGGLTQSAISYVHDLADGYTKRPTNRTYRIYDHTAIVTSTQQTFKLFDKDTIFFNARTTKVFVKKDDGWKMAYVSYAPLPVFYHQLNYNNNPVFNSYAGLYKSGKITSDTVLIKEGRVFLSAAGAPPSELFTINDSTFLSDGYFGYTKFAKNKDGLVTHMYYEYPDGQRLIFPKIK